MDPGSIRNRLKVGQAKEQPGNSSGEQTNKHGKGSKKTCEVFICKQNDDQGEKSQPQMLRVAETLAYMLVPSG